MTRTLLLRLAAPRQSWGAHATQKFRPTEKVPTRSGLEGLLGAALGVPRGETDEDVQRLAIHVRVDRAGAVEEDYQTVSPPPVDVAESRRRDKRIRTRERLNRADFTVPIGSGGPWVHNGVIHTFTSHRLYLADAEFIAAFTGPSDIVERIADAVHDPVFAPYLGRQAFAPQFPFHLGTRAGDGITTLSRLASTAPAGRALPVHAIEEHTTTQVARIDPERTNSPLEAWKHP